jgi:glycogen debranching enzyme
VDLDSCVVLPDEVTRTYRDGVSVRTALIGGIDDRGQTHGLVVRVSTRSPGDLSVSIERGNGSAPVLYGGPGGEAKNEAVALHNLSSGTFLLLSSPDHVSDPLMEKTFRAVDSLLASRRQRMENLLNESYLWTSDRTLNRAVGWMKLMLDGLVVESADTFAVSGLPWDGSVNGRDNAQSIAGLGLATGDFVKTAGILRYLARWQDTVASHSTYGRVADRIYNGRGTYNGADVGPWFFREMYEHATYTGDTALVRHLYPAVKRGLIGTEKYHRDADNFLVHGDFETWMTTVPRGNRSAEIQLLWHFQQLIGSFAASFMGDTAFAARWASGASETAASFASAFVDTARNRIYDHLTPDGKGSPELRPNAMMCLEIINSDLVQESILKEIINNLVYPQGVGTLGFRADGFCDSVSSTSRTQEEEIYQGPVWTWLAGPLIYAMTRYDRQDFCYRITEGMAREAVEHGVVGALPSAFEVHARAGEARLRAIGAQVSLTAMAEFMRALYQDYLGIRIDASSNLIGIQPKLPGEISRADFTVFSGKHPIQGTYQQGKETSRLMLLAPDIPSPMKLQFVWVMADGNAWKGTTSVPPRIPLRVVFGPNDVVAYQGDTKVQIVGEWKLRGFSRRNEFTGFDFADPSRR